MNFLPTDKTSSSAVSTDSKRYIKQIKSKLRTKLYKMYKRYKSKYSLGPELIDIDKI